MGSDHLGSTSFVSDATQALVSRQEYFPSGEQWLDMDSPTQGIPPTYLFNGKELDTETGLYYYGARYYDPRVQVWASPDPILAQYMRGEPGGGVIQPINLSLYSYAWNNPVAIRDPNGACPQCIGDFLASHANDSPLAKAQFESFNRGTAISAAFITGVGAVGSLAESALAWAGWGGVRAGATAAGATAPSPGGAAAAGAAIVGATVATHPELVEDAPEVAGRLTAEGEELAQGVVELSSSAIRFSQKSVNDVAEKVVSMAKNGWQGNPIDVVRMKDGLLTAIDNTRLLAAHITNTPVQAVVHDADEALPASQLERFEGATTWGQAVAGRIANQGAAYRNLYPDGSWVTGNRGEK